MYYFLRYILSIGGVRVARWTLKLCIEIWDELWWCLLPSSHNFWRWWILLVFWPCYAEGCRNERVCSWGVHLLWYLGSFMTWRKCAWNGECVLKSSSWVRKLKSMYNPFISSRQNATARTAGNLPRYVQTDSFLPLPFTALRHRCPRDRVSPYHHHHHHHLIIS